mmetsp:Transcript_37642/g.100119  ORF Transcript_37642/g.100119 Transcript_37642/m.100119 type:complete len:111 (-) Transcript_37642:1088-1420(-)
MESPHVVTIQLEPVIMHRASFSLRLRASVHQAKITTQFKPPDLKSQLLATVARESLEQQPPWHRPSDCRKAHTTTFSLGRMSGHSAMFAANLAARASWPKTSDVAHCTFK